MASVTLLQTIPASNRQAGSHKFSYVVPADLAEEWIRMTTTMNDQNFRDPNNAFYLRLWLDQGGVDQLTVGEIRWRGNPNPPENDRPDISCKVVEPGKWDLRGSTIRGEIQLDDAMNLGAVIEGVTY